MRRPIKARTQPVSLWSLLVASAVAMVLIIQPPVTQAEEINRVVLRVNDEILTLYDYERRKAQEINGLLENPNLSPADRQDRLGDVPKAVLFGVFREMLLESHAARTGTTVTEREIDATIDGMREQQGIPNNEALRQALAASGMTYEELRENVRQEVILSQVIRRDVTSKIEVPEDELRGYYRNNTEEFRVPEERHLEEIIVLEASGLGEAELEQKAQDLLAEVRAGAAFAEVAERYQSQGVSSGIIELGWLKKGDLGSDLGDAAWSLEPGQVSEPIDGRGGFHILHLLEARGGEILPYSEVEDRIIAVERNRRFGKQLNEFMAELAETSYIVEDIPPEAIGYRALSDFADTGDEELPGFRGPLQAPEDGEAVDAGATSEMEPGGGEVSSSGDDATE
ncbi:MAG: peptidyl-prolyl cis-trans isomerase [Thermoanaerobaculia bacterium]|nr:peptidyl-prolyl cis-trans isomerase [Thermoanaerobaculia bacterium]